MLNVIFTTLQITVNQNVSDYLISTVCVAEYTARAMTSEPDKPKS